MNAPVGQEPHSLPLHRQIAEALTQQVTGGQLQPGQRLPSERKIAEQFGASRATVRTALHHLEQSGIITRRERRSAIVRIRRHSAPSVRIVCGSARILHLFRRLSHVQVLPAHCQFQYVDLQQAGSIEHVLTHPGDTGDVLICDLEYLPCLSAREAYYMPISQNEFSDAHLVHLLDGHLLHQRLYRAVPLALSPLMLFMNRAVISKHDAAGPLATAEAILKFVAEGVKAPAYALQIRPLLSHLTAWFRWFDANLCGAENHGDVTSPAFQYALEALRDALHAKKSIPILARTEQINLFSRGRCALAVDGLEQLENYRKQLGEDLEIAPLPQLDHSGYILSGLAAVVLPGQENAQPAIDLLRNLLSSTIQRLWPRMGVGLSVREDLLSESALIDQGISTDWARMILDVLHRSKLPPFPADPQTKAAMEDLFLELWLGLEPFDQILSRLELLLK